MDMFDLDENDEFYALSNSFAGSKDSPSLDVDDQRKAVKSYTGGF